ncbi:MAG: hypothetical protein A2X94_06355 [Bdellovibrionales bacterium GWB1_55_8]|nr:MAG: hypothetical protein A2X94_06355 [Bdellovibrionales bacterium GWB1_55_8]
MERNVEITDFSREWLETNRIGSFAMGSVDRIPRRKYHSLLTVREPGHGEPLNILLGVGEHIEKDDRLFMLSSFDFGDRTEPKGFQHLRSFSFRPMPRWIYEVDGMTLERTFELDYEKDIIRIFYQIRGVRAPMTVALRPFMLCRPWHKLTSENPFLNGASREVNGIVSFRFYDSLPEVQMRVVGQKSEFATRGQWVKSIFYRTEHERGYPALEDSYVPGEFRLRVEQDCSFVFELGTDALPAESVEARTAPRRSVGQWETVVEKLEWAAEKYLVSSKAGDFHSIIAGFPWFGSWGRDAFIALPGICLESDDLNRADAILRSYGDLIIEGLVKQGIVADFPEKNLIMTGIDTPLLYIRAVQLLREQAPFATDFMPTVCRILNALRSGADKRVRVTDDGGLFLQPGPWAVTWMDVLWNGQPVTPRTGFAVDINALFLNAVKFAMDWARAHDPTFVREWASIAEKAEGSFLKRFWSDQFGFLADSHDGQQADFSVRPNQLWALALPYSAVSREMGTRILEKVESDLVTPVGLRTLSPKDPRYVGRYAGGPHQRDHAYHQGTVWPWLIGIYADAVLKVHGESKMKKKIHPLIERLGNHLDTEGCLGHVAEVFDGDEPHESGGTPAQAWSVSELLRVARRVSK